MQKELDKKLKLDSIDWVEVIEGLNGKVKFNSFDIKRALHKTGRCFNDNAPFRAVVKRFIESLGSTVTTKMENGLITYEITSTKDAIEKIRPTKKKPCPKFPEIKTEDVKVEEKATIVIPREDKIRHLFKRSYTYLEHAIYLLAVFIRHSETSLSGYVIKQELTDLGINYIGTFLPGSRPVISEIYKCLGYRKLVITTLGRLKGSKWSLEGEMDLIDEYTDLCGIYEKLTGKKFKDLDDYITATPSKEEVTRKYETLKATLEEKMKAPIEPREEKDVEIVWKKWLLISASKNFMGASTSISNLVSWIKTQRNYKIDEEEARKLCCELMEDSEWGFKIDPSNHVTMTETSWAKLKKYYTPKQFKETLLITIPSILDNVPSMFPDLDIRFEDNTHRGNSLYYVFVDRSIKCELALKKLLYLIRYLNGNVYLAEKSWMITRVSEIISKEESEEKKNNLLLLKLEE